VSLESSFVNTSSKIILFYFTILKENENIKKISNTTPAPFNDDYGMIQDIVKICFKAHDNKKVIDKYKAKLNMLVHEYRKATIKKY
jgi:hypothetical protein